MFHFKTASLQPCSDVCILQAPAKPPRRLAARRSTILEGLYSGLAVAAAPAPAGPLFESKMAMLVEAPAAVEDALASLLDHHDTTLQVGLVPVSLGLAVPAKAFELVSTIAMSLWAPANSTSSE